MTMRLGLLSASLGIESDDENLPELIQMGAEAFIRAGGCVTLTEWAALSPEERDALIDAREAVEEDAGGVQNALDEAVAS